VRTPETLNLKMTKLTLPTIADAMRALLLLAIVASAIVARPSIAEANERSEAREHFAKGTKAFELGAYDEAIAEYSAAYRIKDDPALLYNLGQAHRLANHPTEALRSYRVFLMKIPDAPNRAEVEQKIAELQKLIEQQQKTQNMPPDSVKAPVSTPTETTTTTQQPEAPTQAAPPQSIVRQPNESALRSARAKMIWGIALAATGVAFAVGGIVSGALAKQASDNLTKLDQSMQKFDYGQQQNGQTEQVLQGVFLGLGGAAVVTGAVLYFVGRHERKVARTVSVVPAIGRGTASAIVEGSF
jgi:tetratricopeptide (TPR) repeat protein